MVSADEHTMYSLASITKPVTATGLMILKERGKLNLDKPIDEYLGDAKLKAWIGSSVEATVRRVANHSSGLPFHYQFFYEDEPYRPPAMDETIQRYGNLITVPGEKYEYSNLGYGVLDYVISRLSGKSYQDFMREEVFLPLDMTHSSVHIGPRLEKYQAIRYGTDGLPIPFYDFDHPGGSAVYSSAHDLVRFGMFHLKAHLPKQRAILSDETIDEMQLQCPPLKNYGIGWFINDNDRGFRRVGHGGGMPGVSTLLTLIPTEKLAVVALSNAASSLPSEVTEEILSVMLPEYAKNRELEAQQKQAKAQEPAPSFRPIPELVGKWSGSIHTYKQEVPIAIWFQESGDVHVQLGDQLKTLLNEVSFKDGNLKGRMKGDIGTEDVNRLPYDLQVSLNLRVGVLNGGVAAVSISGRRGGYGLSHWVELKKQETKEG
jgi:CubicO group peptidase (beta-lactamase class C family)